MAAAGEQTLGVTHMGHIAQRLHDLLQLAFHHVALAAEAGETCAGDGENLGLRHVLERLPERAGGHITHAQHKAGRILAQQLIATMQQVGSQLLAQAAAGFGQYGHAQGLRQPEHGFLLIRVQPADEQHQPFHGAETQHLRHRHQRTSETRGRWGLAYLHRAEIAAGRLGIHIEPHMQVQGEAFAQGFHQIGQVRYGAGQAHLEGGGIHAEKSFLFHTLRGACATASGGGIHGEHHERAALVVGIDHGRSHGGSRGAAAGHHDHGAGSSLHTAQRKEGGGAVIGHAPAVHHGAIGQGAVKGDIQFTGAAYPFGDTGHGRA